MATPLTPKDSGGQKSATKKARSAKDTPDKGGSDGRRAEAPAAKAATKTKRLPAATMRALRELEAGELTRYADADDLFKKLGIKLGED